MSVLPHEFAHLLEETGMTLSVAASRAGIPRSTLERYLSGESGSLWTRNEAKLDRLMGELRLEAAAKEPEAQPLKQVAAGEEGKKLYATRLLKETFQLIDYAVEHADQQVFFGACRAGAGKTAAARYRCAQARRGSYFYVESPDGASKKTLLRRLCADLGLAWDGAAPANQERLIDFLRANPKLLIIDQAEELSRQALNALQYIWDQTGTPVVLLGTYKLVSRAVTGRSMNDLERLRTRLWKRDLPAPSPAEVAGICQAELGRRPWAVGAFQEFYLRTGQGSLRQIFAGIRGLEQVLKAGGKNGNCARGAAAPGAQSITREMVTVVARHLL